MNEFEEEKRTVPVNVEGRVYSVDIDEPLTIKELSFYLKRHRSYLSAMKKAGFEMPVDPHDRQGKATLSDAWKWLEANLDFNYNQVYKNNG